VETDITKHATNFGHVMIGARGVDLVEDKDDWEAHAEEDANQLNGKAS